MTFLRGLYLSLLAIVCVLVSLSPKYGAAQSYSVCNEKAVGVGAAPRIQSDNYCLPTPTPTPTFTPTPTPTPLASPTSFEQTVVMADQVVDSMAAVNAAYCAGGTNYGPMPSPSPAALETDPPALMYLKLGGFRHVRDGYINCFNQNNYNAVYTSLHQYEGISLIGTNASGYSPAEIASLTSNNPAIEALAGQNEWDVFTWPASAITKAAIAAGGTTLTIPAQILSYFVPGSLYQLEDGEFTETVQAGMPIDANDITISPTVFAHTSGVQVVRVSNAYQDIANWLAFEGPLIRYYQPTFPILGWSLAFPANSSNFATYGAQFPGYVNVLEQHGYSNPDGSNPEGASGDGAEGYNAGSGTCAVDGMVNSWNSNTCSTLQQVGASNPAQYLSYGSIAPVPTWQTEYSYHSVPVGSAYNSYFGPGQLPDDVAAKYIARSEFFAPMHNVSRIYYFQVMTGTDGATGGFCPYGLVRTSNAIDDGLQLVSCDPSNPTYPSTGTIVTPGFATLNSLIRYFSDAGCKYPSCQFRPSIVYPSWSPDTLPLNHLNVQWSNGQLALIAWLGAKSYDYTNAACTSGTVDCYVTVSPRSETLTVPFMTSATLTALDDTSTDPTPAPYNTTAPDGVSEYGVGLCHTTAESSFGCIKAATSLTVTNAGTVSASVTFNVTDVPQWVIPQFASPLAVTTASPSPTQNPIAPNASPSFLPNAAQPTAPPSPAPTSSTILNASVQCVTQANSGSAAPNKTFTFNLACTPYAGDLLIGFVYAADTSVPVSSGAVTEDVPLGWKQFGTGGQYGGNFGQANLVYKYALGTESSVTITDPNSHQFWWNVTVYDVGNPGTVTATTAETSSLTPSTASLTPSVANTIAIALYGIQNADNGAAVSPYWSIAAAGWGMTWPNQTTVSGPNNIVESSAWKFLTNTNPLSQQATFSDSGGNLFAAGGVADMVMIAPGNETIPNTATPTPAPTASQTPPPTPTPEPTLSPSVVAVSLANSGSAAMNKTFTGSITAAQANDTLLVYLFQDGVTKPTSAGNVVNPNAPSGCTRIGSTKYAGTLGQSSVYQCSTFAGESTLTFSDPTSAQYNWTLISDELSSAGTITCSTNATTSLTQGTPSLTPSTTGGYAFAFFGVQDSSTGAPSGMTGTLSTPSGWTATSVESTAQSGSNNGVAYGAYLPLGSLSGAISQGSTLSGTNLTSTVGTAALCLVAHL